MSATKIRTDLLLATSLELWHKLAGYVVLVLLARHLAKAAMGDLLLALAVSSFGAVVTELGTSRLLVREIAQGAEATLARLGEVLALRVPLAAAVYAALVGGTFALRPALGPVVALAAAAVLLGDLYHSFGAVFVGRREVWLRLATGMVGSLVLIPLVVLALRLGAGLGGVLVCYVAAAAVSLAVAAAAVRARVGPVRVAWGASAAWAAAQPAFPFFLMTALGLAHFKADTVLLYLLASPATVATYEAA
ncbi:MAG TPA: oligosaccharide flippase family protein, partial [Gemmatimonadales bacterium]|nr:oligosaccharide flippase family protein [Gemmatimonadales bacterium]